jgi:hypothetical protein
MADVAVRGAELFSVKLPKASQHNFSLSEDGFDLSRECDQIVEFASAGPKCPDACLVVEALLTEMMGVAVKEHCTHAQRPSCCFEVS